MVEESRTAGAGQRDLPDPDLCRGRGGTLIDRTAGGTGGWIRGEMQVFSCCNCTCLVCLLRSFMCRCLLCVVVYSILRINDNTKKYFSIQPTIPILCVFILNSSIKQ